MIYSSKPEPTKVGQFTSENDAIPLTTFERVNGICEDKSERFRLKDRTFNRQYAHLYAERLWAFRPRLNEAAKAKWGKY